MRKFDINKLLRNWQEREEAAMGKVFDIVCCHFCRIVDPLMYKGENNTRINKKPEDKRLFYLSIFAM